MFECYTSLEINLGIEHKTVSNERELLVQLKSTFLPEILSTIIRNASPKLHAPIVNMQRWMDNTIMV